MAALRASFIVFALVGFFLVGAPLQTVVVRHFPRWSDRIPIFFCRFLLKILRVSVRVKGRCATGRPVLIAANHVSWIDILAFGSIMPFCFVAKGEVGSWPILSAFASVQGTIFLDRTCRRSIPRSNRQMAERMIEGRPVLLFPEGTTVGKPGPARFYTSHFAAARDVLILNPAVNSVAVQPVAVDYSSETAAWIGDDDLVSHLWRTLRRPPLRCFIGFGTPLDYTAASDRKTIGRCAREAIIEMIGANDLLGDAALLPLAIGRTIGRAVGSTDAR